MKLPGPLASRSPGRAWDRSAAASRGASALAAGGVVALAAGGCFTGDIGLSAPPNIFYFPTGVVLSPGRTTMYVANSDFDLQYNGGTVLDVALATQHFPTPCRPVTASQPTNDCVHLQGAQCDPVQQTCQVRGLRSLVGGIIGLLNGGAVDPGLQAACQPGTQGGSLNAVSPIVCEACGSAGILPNPVSGSMPPFDSTENQFLNPGPCSPIEPFSSGLFVNGAGIGAFASGAILVPNRAAAGARLFVSDRGDPSITYLDVDDDRNPKAVVHPAPCSGPFCVECGQAAGSFDCDESHRVGKNPYDNPRGLLLPVEPFGLDADDDGVAIVTAHQTQAAVSLTLNRFDTQGPTLEYVFENTPTGPSAVAHIPRPAIATRAPPTAPCGPTSVAPFAYTPGFLVTYQSSPELDLYTFHDDAGSCPPRPFLNRSFAIPIVVDESGVDSRGIALDPSARQACEAACAGSADVTFCLAACATIPIRLFMANRSPPTLLVGEVQTRLELSPTPGAAPVGAGDVPVLLFNVPLETGPSRVAMGQVIGFDGKLHWRVFAVTFDGQYIFDYDPDSQTVEATIRTGRGPDGIAFDTGDDAEVGLHSYLYVAQFTDSYVGVIDLDLRHAATFGSMVATVGQPIAPRESK